MLARMDPAMPAPTSLQASLHKLVDDSPITSFHALELPLLVKRRATVVRRSIDLLRIFRVLKHTADELCALVIFRSSTRTVATRCITRKIACFPLRVSHCSVCLIAPCNMCLAQKGLPTEP